MKESLRHNSEFVKIFLQVFIPCQSDVFDHQFDQKTIMDIA